MCLATYISRNKQLNKGESHDKNSNNNINTWNSIRFTIYPSHHHRYTITWNTIAQGTIKIKGESHETIRIRKEKIE